MSFYINDNGTWKPQTSLRVNVAGTWTQAKQLYVNVGGVWKPTLSDIPPNMIVLYSSSSDIPSDATLYSSAYSRFPYGLATAGTTGGTSTHNGSQHGAFNGSTGITANGGYGFNKGLSGWATTVISHTHTINHTHSSTENVSHIPPYLDLIPTYGASGINPNAIFLSDTDLSAVWTAYTALYNSYLRFGSIGGATGGSATHQHAGYSGNTSSVIDASSVQADSSGYATHYHIMSHTHTAQPNSPAYVILDAYKTSTLSYLLSDLPIGTIAFFTSSTLPSGWTRYTLADSRLIKCSNTSRGTQGGSNSDTLPEQAFITGGMGGSGNPRALSGSSNYLSSLSDHTMNHGHSTVVDITPPYFSVVIAKKTS